MKTIENKRRVTGAVRETAMDKAINLYTDMLIKELESFEGNYEKPWAITNASTGAPVNLEGKGYNGKNFFLLSLYQSQNIWKTSIYGTYNAFNELNFCTKKGQKIRRTNDKGEQLPLIHILQGEKGFPVIYAKYVYYNEETKEKITENEYCALSKEEKKNYKTYPINKLYYVFNIAQTNIKDVDIDLYKKILDKCNQKEDEPKVINKDSEFKPVKKLLENPKKLWYCNITQRVQDAAYYMPFYNEIFIPMREIFYNEDGFCGTLFHEMGHSTGHKDVFNRTFGNKRTKQYAKEELIAELSAAIACSHFNLTKNLQKDALPYLKGWLSILKEEPKFLRSILSEANKASQAIIKKVEFAGGKELENETEVKKEVKTQTIEIEEEEFVLTPEC